MCGAINAPHYRSTKSNRCVACYKAYQREYRQRFEHSFKRVTKDKKYSLSKRYGLTVQGYAYLGELQGWACAICGMKFNDASRASWAHVDHCHKSGKTRGLLCNGCNRALGFIQDRPDVALSMANYLIKHRAVQRWGRRRLRPSSAPGGDTGLCDSTRA